MNRLNYLGFFIKRHFKTLIPFLTIKRVINILKAYSEFIFRKVKCNSLPFIYRIDPCTACNLKCVSCTTPKTNANDKRIMDFSDYLKILEKLKNNALRFSLYDLGEPLLHKDIYNFIKAASANKISTLISTNFNLFRKSDINKLFDSRLTVLEPCLDGFTQEAYEKYRVNGNVQVVKDGIEMVMNQKRLRKSTYPIVDVQVIRFDHVIDELPMINEYLKSLNVDKITYREDYRKLNKKRTNKKMTCFWLYFGMVIRPDGNVYPCCGRGFDRLSYGNILTQSLNDIWNNEYYQFSRSLFTNNRDIKYSEKFKDVPCLTCNLFIRIKEILPSQFEDKINNSTLV